MHELLDLILGASKVDGCRKGRVLIRNHSCANLYHFLVQKSLYDIGLSADKVYSVKERKFGGLADLWV